MGTMTATAPAKFYPPFTLLDRCDQCKVQAWTGWVHPENSPDEPMKFCAHDTRTHEEVLVTSGWVMVVDQRPSLLAQETR